MGCRSPFHPRTCPYQLVSPKERDQVAFNLDPESGTVSGTPQLDLPQAEKCPLKVDDSFGFTLLCCLGFWGLQFSAITLFRLTSLNLWGRFGTPNLRTVFPPTPHEVETKPALPRPRPPPALGVPLRLRLALGQVDNVPRITVITSYSNPLRIPTG